LGNHDWIPDGYYLDESDKEMLCLRRDDGFPLAFFLPEKVTISAVLQTIVKDKEWTAITKSKDKKR
jgi:hypothetical protein